MTSDGDGEKVPSESIARWLTGVLLRGLSAEDEARVADILAEPGDHAGILSVIAARATRLSDQPGSGIVEAGRAAAGATAKSNSVALTRWKEVGEAFEGQQLRWAALHGLSHLGTLYPAPEGRLVSTFHVLVHDYDAPRARVLLASRGLTCGGGERRPWRYRSDTISVSLFDGLQPAAFAPLPLSPFLEEAQLEEETMVRRMPEDAAFAAHRLLGARNLWDPALSDPLHAAEAALLSQRAGNEAAEVWAQRCGRWRIRKLWQRAAEVDCWLLGGARPGWLAADYGSFPARDVPRPQPLREGLALQDSVAGMAAYLVRRLVLRQL